MVIDLVVHGGYRFKVGVELITEWGVESVVELGVEFKGGDFIFHGEV